MHDGKLFLRADLTCEETLSVVVGLSSSLGY